jgi:multidrug efflux pump subunit AcrB
MKMIASQYIAVSREGSSLEELSDFSKSDVVPYLERQEGVASVKGIGMVERSVQVELNADKIGLLNDRILEKTDAALAAARQQLDDAEAKVKEGEDALNEQEAQFGQTVSATLFDQIRAGAASMTPEIQSQLEQVSQKLDSFLSMSAQVEQQADQTLTQTAASLEAARLAAEARMQEAQKLYQDAQTAYNEAKSVYDEADLAARTEAEAYLSQLNEGTTQTAQDADALIREYLSGDERLAQLKAQYEAAAEQLSSTAQTFTDAQASLTALLVQTAGTSAGVQAVTDSESLRSQLTVLNADLLAVRDGMNSSLTGLMAGAARINALIPQVTSVMNQLAAQDLTGTLTQEVGKVQGGISSLQEILDNLPSLLDQMETGFAALTQGQLDAAVGFSSAANQLTDASTQLKAARATYEAQKSAALKNANADALLSPATLAKLIYAQNFSMPAGYIDDEQDNSWLLKVGDEYNSSEDIAGSLLTKSDEIGTVRLQDVADVTVIDNAGTSYTRLNGEDSVLMSVYKSPSVGTNTVSKNVKDALKTLGEKYEGFHSVILMDQGSYIGLIVQDILMSMITGMILAILILAIFLRDIKPTLLVGISIPLSVLAALLLLYFSRLSLNIMTLSGLSLGVGMLVDNSIVVIENIFRLRGKGMTAPRAAVQGTRQVAGSIIASTVTTVCVFLPLVFTKGTVRELMIPLGLSIGYCLIASLVAAMTVVPAAASTILRNSRAKKDRLGEKIHQLYADALTICLNHRFAVLGAALALFALSVFILVRMGIVMLPDMTGNNIQVTIVTPDTDTRDASYGKADQVMNAILKLDNVKDVGMMDQSSTQSMMQTAAASEGTYGSYVCYVTPSDSHSGKAMRQLAENIEKAAEGIDAKVTASAAGMEDMSALMSSGLSVNLYGSDLTELQKAAADVSGIVESVKGFSDVKTGVEKAEKTLHLKIDKDKAMSYGLTTAQIYAEIATRLSTSVTSTSITVNGETMDVKLVDKTDQLLKENLMDMEFTATDTASQAMASSGSSSTGDAMASLGAGSSSSGMASLAGSSSTGTAASGTASSGDMSAGLQQSASQSGTEEVHKLSEFAELEETEAPSSITRSDLNRYVTVTAVTDKGYNTALLSRTLSKKLDSYAAPEGIRVEIGGETSQISNMITQMVKLMSIALLFIYLVMVAQFQSLLSPFIVMFTIPLAFTGGMLGLILAGEQLSLLSMIGFLILMGTVVNNGIVFVDYANLLRLGGLDKRTALIATGQTRMRPILMTALTTILAMTQLIFGNGMGAQMGRGMAIVISAGLLYATFMTLFIVPVMYDILFRRKPLTVDIGSDMDEAPDDASDYLKQLKDSEHL